MPERAVINDLVDGQDPHFGRFRGVVTDILSDGERSEAWLGEPIAYVAVLGFRHLVSAPIGALTVIRGGVIPELP